MQQERVFKVVAEFLETSPSNKGWQYRSLKLGAEATESSIKTLDGNIDTIMPHFGSVFGLTETATALILVELGCLELHNNRKTTRFMQDGWGKLGAQFRVLDLLETSKVRMGKKTAWYIHLG